MAPAALNEIIIVTKTMPAGTLWFLLRALGAGAGCLCEGGSIVERAIGRGLAKPSRAEPTADHWPMIGLLDSAQSCCSLLN